jgi:hypothetical protein
MDGELKKIAMISHPQLESNSMLQEQVIAEIKQIPPEKLSEVYHLIHCFRVNLSYKTQPQLTALTFSQRWQGQFKIHDELNDERADYLKQRYQL